MWVYLLALAPLLIINNLTDRWEEQIQKGSGIQNKRYSNYEYTPKRLRKRDVITPLLTSVQQFTQPIWEWVERVINDFDTRAYRIKRYRQPRYFNRNSPHKVRHRNNYKGSRLLRQLVSVQHDMLGFTSTSATHNKQRQIAFDTDSEPIGIDNRSTRCISSYKTDFEGDLTPIASKIRGLTGLTKGQLYVGTIVWSIEDDDGVVHKLTIPNSIYCPEVTIRLLSPQHWAQIAKDHSPIPKGTRCITYDDSVVLEWAQRRYKRTLPLIQHGTNVANLHTAPGYQHFQSFHSDLVNVVSDDELDIESVCDDYSIEEGESAQHDTRLSEGASEGASEGDPEAGAIEGVSEGDQETPTISTIEWDPTTFLNGPSTPEIIPQEETIPHGDPAAEFLHWHHRLGHCSYEKIRTMARQNILPKRLATCRAPTCSACIYGKMHRRPWKGKTTKATQPITATAPGQVVSIDQMISKTPGLIAQLRGIPTTKRYKCATVFVDQYSKFGYVHLQKSTSAAETIEAKKAFEDIAATHGVQVRRYHADNGVFADNAFRKAVQQDRQSLTFCAANAHFQNGIAEKRIRDLSELARTMLIHANRRWPNAVDHHLWPYALRHANEVTNNTPIIKHKDNKTPTQLFSDSDVNINPKHWAPFGCPTYVLHSPLAQQKTHPKWSERARVGINLGFSKQHARSVSLVLSLQTGLVSPQFHIRFDGRFETMKRTFEHNPPVSKWQQKCHFTKDSAQPKPSDLGLSDAILPTERTEEDNTIHHHENITPSEGDDSNIETVSETQTPTTNSEDLRRSNRRRTKTQRLIEVFQAKMELVKESFVAFEACAQPDAYETPNELLTYKATSDPDTLYLHEAMREPDKDKFIEAMVKEIRGQEENGNWIVRPRKEIPNDAIVLPAVWAFRRKRRITTQEVYKWKARLNLDGSKMIAGYHYDDTYSPLASWSIIRLALILTAINGWHSKQIDYVMAFPQSPVERDNVYMKIPKGFTLPDGLDPKDYVLHIKKNIYGGKAASRVWNQYLVEKLRKAGFIQSKFDECVFYYKSTLYILYCDDSILTGPNKDEIEEAFVKLKEQQLQVTDEGDVGDFLGVRIDKEEDGSIHLRQPHLIDSILKDLKMTDTTATKETPAKVKTPLFRYPEKEPFNNSFNYRSIIGKLGYLETTRPDIAYATHSCARFSSDPKEPHAAAIRWIGRYLAATKETGVILKPDMSESFKVYVDADFAGNYDQEDTNNPDTARSRTGYIITYAGCPIYWKSSLQTEISLSSTESEYIGISEALRTTIPLMNLIGEMKEMKFPVISDAPKILCQVFEDNSGAIEIAKDPKFRPRTKHLKVKYHFFRSDVPSRVNVEKIGTKNQPADYLTKSFDAETFKPDTSTLHTVEDRFQKKHFPQNV